MARIDNLLQSGAVDLGQTVDRTLPAGGPHLHVHPGSIAIVGTLNTASGLERLDVKIGFLHQRSKTVLRQIGDGLPVPNRAGGEEQDSRGDETGPHAAQQFHQFETDGKFRTSHANISPLWLLTVYVLPRTEHGSDNDGFDEPGGSSARQWLVGTGNLGRCDDRGLFPESAAKQGDAYGGGDQNPSGGAHNVTESKRATALR